MVKSKIVSKKILSSGEKLFDIGVYIFLCLAVILTIFPLLYVLSVSMTPYEEVLRNGGFVIIPRKLTVDAYRIFLDDRRILSSYGVTFFITIVGTAINIPLTILMAYPLSKKDLPGSHAISLFVLFTMLFSGGMIPKYLVIKGLGLMDSIWSLILPISIVPYNVILMCTFFKALPDELYEAALIDGAGEIRMLLSIAVPLSIPSIMTNVVYYGVMHWNTFMSAILYITNPNLQPLQVVLRGIIAGSEQIEEAAEYTAPTETLKMAAVVLTSLPIMVVYPFIQKYFASGMLVGAIKG